MRSAEYSPGSCVLPHRHDPDRLRRAIDGGYVCLGCYRSVTRALAQLEPLHRLLGETRALSTAPARNGSRSTAVPMPLYPEAANLRQAMRVKLSGWIPLVAENRRLSVPRIDAVNGSDPAMAAIMNWLKPHIEWLLHEDPEGFATEVTELQGAAYSMAYPSGRVWRRFADCPEPECAGILGAHLASGDLLPQLLHCDTCTAAVPPSKWLTGRPTTLLSAVELSALWDVPLRTVQRWATQADWPHDGGWPARYDTTAAQRTLDTHRALVTPAVAR